MTTITTHEAKTHLSRYLADVELGKEFIIARGKTAVAMLVPMKKPKQKRPKIISPSRQKYETNFESYYISKHLEKKIEE